MSSSSTRGLPRAVKHFRPALEALDDRVAPAVASIPGQGIYSIPTTITLGSPVEICPTPAVALAQGLNGVVVASFDTGGVTGTWYYNGVPGSWQRISTYTANSIALDRNNAVVASFDTIGVWRQLGIGYPAMIYTELWTQLSGCPANTLALSSDGGHLLASFAGLGVQSWTPGASVWTPLSSLTASSLAVNSHGDMAGAFEDGHLWYAAAGSNWEVLSDLPATAVALNDAGVMVASFEGYGVGSHVQGTQWQQISTLEAKDLALSGVYTTPFAHLIIPQRSYYDLLGAFGAAGLWDQQLTWRGPSIDFMHSGQIIPGEPMPYPTDHWVQINPAFTDLVAASSATDY
jgi:hypothetical protein